MHVYSRPYEKSMFILDFWYAGQPTMAKLHGINKYLFKIFKEDCFCHRGYL